MSKGKHKRELERAEQKTQPLRLPDCEVKGSQQKAQSEAANSKRYNEQESAIPLSDRVKQYGITDWLLAIFTLALVGTSVYQMVILGGQLDTMRKDQRAWVYVTEKSPPVPIVGTAPFVDLSINNAGKTPATNVVGQFYIEVVPNGQNPRFEQNIMHTLFSTGAIIPNAPHDGHIVRKKVAADEADPLLESEKAALITGKAWIAVHGSVYYDDTFHTRHYTKFCTWSNFANGTYTAEACTRYNSVGDQ
jgi:hypothetical protein